MRHHALTARIACPRAALYFTPKKRLREEWQMADHTHGEMDVTEQEKTFAGFMRWTVWTVVIIAIVLAFLGLTQT